MATDKSLLPIAGRPLVEHIALQLRPLVDELFLGANDPGKYAFLGLPVVPDEQPGQGPLMGILSCLAAAKHNPVFITACDIPAFPRDFVQGMLLRAARADLVIPRHDDGRYEPLLAVYSRGLVPAIRSLLAAGKRRLVDILDIPGIRVDPVPMPKGDWYRNLNTPDEYQSYIQL
jgi:molybdopterin-guanine dinucleotide biosynthesis protein A